VTQLPKISVVTPAYRSGATIEQTIQSVLSQSYRNVEYIVMDGAGDDTADILRRYDDRLTHWRSEPDGGQYDAIRKGFERATGDVFYWINADDKLLPDALQIVAEAFGRFEEVDWISSLSPGRYDAWGYYGGHDTVPGFSREAFLDGYNLPGRLRFGRFIQQESTFFRRRLWDGLERPFGDFKLAGDFALWCQFYKSTDLVGLTYPLAGFRCIAGQRSENLVDYVAEAEVALRDLRAHFGHKGSRPRVDQYRRLGRMPRVGRMVIERLGYEGKRIVRERLRFPDAGWSLQDHRFLP
jgi:glycosyltransferase involved in cell wall biosynthesis